MKKQLGNEQVGTLCAALGHLMGAGISLSEAFLLLSADEDDRFLRDILGDMTRRADEGLPLAAVFREAGCFPGYVCSLLSVAEQVGQTEQALLNLGQHYANRAKLTRQLWASLSYPAMLLAVLIGVLAVLLIWVLPIFDEIYAQLGTGLTGFAGVLLDLGQFLGRSLPWICGILLILLCAALCRPLRRKIIGFCQKHWGDRGIWEQINSARFLETLSLGLGSGMTESATLTLAAESADSAAPGYTRRVDALAEQLTQGVSLPKALAQARFLSPAQSRLLEAARRSGHGDQVLASMAGEALDRSEEALTRATERIEPALVTLACALIGLVLVSVMLPLMNIMNGIGG